VDNLQDSFAGARDILFQLNIADIALDISQSVPLGGLVQQMPQSINGSRQRVAVIL